jgi:hypothetical protein
MPHNLKILPEATGLKLNKQPQDYIKDGRLNFNPDEISFDGSKDCLG